jgi:hypothetical protein
MATIRAVGLYRAKPDRLKSDTGIVENEYIPGWNAPPLGCVDE